MPEPGQDTCISQFCRVFSLVDLSRDKALRGAVRSRLYQLRVRRMITSNPKIEVTHQRVSLDREYFG